MDESDRRTLLDWLEAWAGRVRARDYAGARELFAPELLGFGTHEAVMRGRDEVEARQWRVVWPTTRGFRFCLQEAALCVSDDRLLAVAMTPWDSTGQDPEGGDGFARPGRATVVLVRAALDAPWRAVHTHFSLDPGSGPGAPRGRSHRSGER